MNWTMFPVESAKGVHQNQGMSSMLPITFCPLQLKKILFTWLPRFLLWLFFSTHPSISLTWHLTLWGVRSLKTQRQVMFIPWTTRENQQRPSITILHLQQEQHQTFLLSNPFSSLLLLRCRHLMQMKIILLPMTMQMRRRHQLSQVYC